jgi:hypothetical protein
MNASSEPTRMTAANNGSSTPNAANPMPSRSTLDGPDKVLDQCATRAPSQTQGADELRKVVTDQYDVGALPNHVGS